MEIRLRMSKLGGECVAGAKPTRCFHSVLGPLADGKGMNTGALTTRSQVSRPSACVGIGMAHFALFLLGAVIWPIRLSSNPPLATKSITEAQADRPEHRTLPQHMK